MNSAASQQEIHVTEAAVDIRPSGNIWYESKAYKSLIALWGIMRLAGTIAVILGGIYIYQHDANAQTGVSVADIARDARDLRAVVEQNHKEVEEIKRTTITADLFKAQFDAMNRRLDRLESALDRIQPR